MTPVYCTTVLKGATLLKVQRCFKIRALTRLAGAVDDVADLEASLGRLADEAGLRTRQEVDAVREQGNKRLTELAEKLQQKDAVRLYGSVCGGGVKGSMAGGRCKTEAGRDRLCLVIGEYMWKCMWGRFTHGMAA